MLYQYINLLNPIHLNVMEMVLSIIQKQRFGPTAIQAN